MYFVNLITVKIELIKLKQREKFKRNIFAPKTRKTEIVKIIRNPNLSLPITYSEV